MKKAPLWKILEKGPEYWSLSGPNTGMLQLLDQDGKNSVAVFAFDGGADFAQNLKKLLKPYAVRGKIIPIKAVCDSAISNMLREVLSKLGFHILRLVERAGEYEIRYYADAAKLQVTMPESNAAKESSKDKIKILIVDDSPIICSILSNVFKEDPELEVVATVGLPSQVEAAICNYRPDVITLDLHLPEMNGVALLNQYLPKYNIPTIIVSSISPDEGPFVLSALESGAVDYIQKPSAMEIDLLAATIVARIKAAAAVSPKNVHDGNVEKVKVDPKDIDFSRIIAIGSSTGGTKALRDIFLRLPKEIPPIIVVQHIPAGFSKAFADRLDKICAFEVKEAVDGDEVKPGRVIIAPGGKHIRLQKSQKGFVVKVDDGEPVNRHKPSVDVMFRSVLENCGADAIGVILTGMGDDGARGLLEMRNKGCFTIAQDEASCVVFGMPQAAINLNAVVRVESLLEIAQALADEITCKPAQKQAG
jgi:two-component system, chemotaxis family, protein-glutamate methylesterase/glutaminase